MRKLGWALISMIGIALVVLAVQSPSKNRDGTEMNLNERENETKASDEADLKFHQGALPPEGPVSDIPDLSMAEDRIVIDKSENELYLFKGGQLVAAYDVATGEEPHFTPEGVFAIANMVEDPRGPNSEASQFGNRWMGLAVPNERDKRGPPDDERAPKGLKYGIHGTNEPESIGEHASAGCVRLDNKDVVALFEQVEVGMKVEIRR